jgi:hypothetical protein
MFGTMFGHIFVLLSSLGQNHRCFAHQNSTHIWKTFVISPAIHIITSCSIHFDLTKCQIFNAVPSCRALPLPGYPQAVCVQRLHKLTGSVVRPPVSGHSGIIKSEEVGSLGSLNWEWFLTCGAKCWRVWIEDGGVFLPSLVGVPGHCSTQGSGCVWAKRGHLLATASFYPSNHMGCSMV